MKIVITHGLVPKRRPGNSPIKIWQSPEKTLKLMSPKLRRVLDKLSICQTGNIARCSWELAQTGSEYLNIWVDGRYITTARDGHHGIYTDTATTTRRIRGNGVSDYPSDRHFKFLI